MTGVIILNYFTHADTLRLYRQLKPFSGLTLLVVDNSADENEAGILRREIPQEELIFSDKNRGYAGGNNLGIRWLTRNDGETGTIDLITLLNPDIELKENIFPSLRRMFEEDGKLAAAGPRLCIRGEESMIYSDGGILTEENGYLKPGHINGGRSLEQISDSDEQTSGDSATDPAGHSGGRSSGYPDHHPSDGQTECESSHSDEFTGRQPDYVNGSFFVMRTEAIRDVGLLDESFFLYFEEVDWCMRARQKGWSVRVSADVTTWQRISEKGERYNYYFFRGWLLFLHKYQKKGVRPLLKEQLKKVKWMIQDGEAPFSKRFRLAWNRFKGICRGAVNV